MGKRKRFSRSLSGNIVVWIFLCVLGTFMALPLVYTVVSAFKPFNEIFIFPPRFFVKRPTTDNFTNLFISASSLWVPLSRYIVNSVFVSGATTFLHVILSSAAAYPLAKHVFPGKNLIFSVTVATLLFTGTVTGLPQYIILSKLGWLNTYLALIMPAAGATMGLFLMRQFIFQMIPDSVIEAARIDGAGELKIFLSIIMPNVRPAWLTLTIFCFQGIWANNGMSVIYSEQLKTLPAALSQVASAGIARAGEGMAAALILIVPPILVFVLSQSRIVETMAFAGLKD